jgi:hypothetical protein
MPEKRFVSKVSNSEEQAARTLYTETNACLPPSKAFPMVPVLVAYRNLFSERLVVVSRDQSIRIEIPILD